MPDPRDKKQAKMRARKHQKANAQSHDESMRDDIQRNDPEERIAEEGDRA